MDIIIFIPKTLLQPFLPRKQPLILSIPSTMRYRKYLLIVSVASLSKSANRRLQFKKDALGSLKFVGVSVCTAPPLNYITDPLDRWAIIQDLN